MEVLGVELPPQLATFYAEVESLLGAAGITLTCELMDGAEFGGFYLLEGEATVGVRRDLPPEAACHTLAHELAHGLQRLGGWPRAVSHPKRGDQSSGEEVAAVLQAIVHCSAAELRIAPLELDASWEQVERHHNIRAMLRAPHRGANQPGTLAWAYWAILYAYISLLHPQERSRALLHNFERAIPAAAAAGRRAAALVREHGYATPDQALAALRAVQDALSLGPNILIEDPRDGAAYGEDPSNREAPPVMGGAELC
jgi:hypothetical protein